MNSTRSCTFGRLSGAWRRAVSPFACFWLAAALPCGAQIKEPFDPGKTGGSDADIRKKLEELADRTEQQRRGEPPAKPGSPPAPTGTPAQPGAALPRMAAPGSGLAGRALFEADFDKAGAKSYSQRRVVVLVFAPNVSVNAWRNAPELQSWSQRVVICPVNSETLGDRAERLAKAFGVDSAAGGMLTALVRAPDGVQQVAPDQLLYQVLGRYPAPRDVVDVLASLQQGIAAYEVKSALYSWDAVLTTDAPSAPQPPPQPSLPDRPSVPAPPTPPPSAAPQPPPSAEVAPRMVGPIAEAGIGPVTDAAPPSPPKAEAAPPESSASAFEKAAASAWRLRKPVLLVFPGNEPFDKAACAAALQSMPRALAPEHVVLSPGDKEGSIGGKMVDWEEFFHVGGQYVHVVLVLPESPEGGTTPKVADMTYRVIGRQQGSLAPDAIATLVRRWMSEDFDAVTLRAWVLHKPMLTVFPHPEQDRLLLSSPELAKLEEKVAVYVNTKGAVSGIRLRTAAALEKDFATEGVERPELVLMKVETTKKKNADVRLDDLIHKPVNRAFAKKTPDKILEWVDSRVSAGAKN